MENNTTFSALIKLLQPYNQNDTTNHFYILYYRPINQFYSYNSMIGACKPQFCSAISILSDKNLLKSHEVVVVWVKLSSFTYYAFLSNMHMRANESIRYYSGEVHLQTEHTGPQTTRCRHHSPKSTQENYPPIP